MRGIPFFIVDVFAARRYEGNQLAVFDARRLPTEALTSDRMQAITRELNFQESTFITGDAAGQGYPVRIFTPEYEVPFAGHPTLGTAWVLAHRLVHTGAAPLTLQLGVGPVAVRWAGATPWLRAAQPRFGPVFEPEALARLLGLAADDLESRWPCQLVSTGLPYVLVPVRSLAAIRKIRLDATAFDAWLQAQQLHQTNNPDRLSAALYLFCRETYSPHNDLNARMLCLERGKVVEDPATGSAGSCLLAYGLKNGVFKREGVEVRVEQGYELDRPSLIQLSGAVTDPQTYRLEVGGEVQYIASGLWELSARG